MSAFICNPEHFHALASFVTLGNLYNPPGIEPAWLRDRCREHGVEMSGDIASTVARILYLENVRSVDHLYQESNDIDPEHWTLRGYPKLFNPVHILKMCDCLEYQSCENEDYRDSLAYLLLERIRKHAIHNLPGYDDAPWDYIGNYTHTVETIRS
jgi:hypothetical protein